MENCIQYNNTFLYALQIWPQRFYWTVTLCFLLQILNLPSMRKALVTITAQYRQYNSDTPQLPNILLCVLPQLAMCPKQWLQIQKCLGSKGNLWLQLEVGSGPLVAVSSCLLQVTLVWDSQPGGHPATGLGPVLNMTEEKWAKLDYFSLYPECNRPVSVSGR